MEGERGFYYKDGKKESPEETAARLRQAFLELSGLEKKKQELDNEIAVLRRQLPPGEPMRIKREADAAFEEAQKSGERKFYYPESKNPENPRQ